MPCGIGELQRVVVDVGVAVIGLGELGVGDRRVRLDEAGEFGVVVSCAVVVEAGVFVQGLACVAAGDAEGQRVVLVVREAWGQALDYALAG